MFVDLFNKSCLCEHHLINFGVTNKLSMQFIAIILCLIWGEFISNESIKTGLVKKRTAILDKVCYYIKNFGTNFSLYGNNLSKSGK